MNMTTEETLEQLDKIARRAEEQAYWCEHASDPKLATALWHVYRGEHHNAIKLLMEMVEDTITETTFSMDD